ncbi:MAG: glucose-6-phosphate dehydrogenase [Polyangiaceae bacterium]|nr:glucose-6-phosphate dehydrogenase [Polyangiaceae bacterium]
MNPLRVGLADDRTVDGCTVVIFGASGDLTKRKLIPALYNLAFGRNLSGSFAVVGVARREKTDAEFHADLEEGVQKFSRRKPIDPAIWNDFKQGLSYVSGTFEDPATYVKLREKLEAIDLERGTRKNRLFYLAVPPSEFENIVGQLRESGLITDSAANSEWTRVVFEKPFGHDYQSAKELNDVIAKAFSEPQVYRIDHYLGKETVQNLLVFRFANSLFEPLWNRKHIDHVQITVAEDIGVEGRGKFFEEIGITKDIVENHLMQLLCLVAMEPPISLDADAVRDEKVKVLRALRPMDASVVAQGVVRGQYGRGIVRAEEAAAYREEADVDPASSVETYVAMKLNIDNWRWGGVPFYVRAGKRMSRKVTEIAIQFQSVPHALFRTLDGGIAPNVLTLRIQPDEGMSIRFTSKEPGQKTVLRDVAMDFRYGTAFGATSPEAYERLLLDAMRGDATLFTRRDEVEEQWSFIDPVFEAWKKAGLSVPPTYASGTAGPEQADDLLARDGRRWRKL